MPLRQLVCFLLLSWSFSSPAATVAFLELQRDGRRVELERGGRYGDRFGHVAIRVGRQWLHAHPDGGVTLVDDIADYGFGVVVLTNVQWPDPSETEVRRWLGKPFDRKYRWNNPEATYCSRLVADLLHVLPEPMNFDAPVWDPVREFMPVGQLGVSPGDVWDALVARGFRETTPPPSRCASALAEAALN